MASLFSGKAGRLAAIAAAEQATRNQGQINDLLGQAQTNGLASLGQGYDSARQLYGDASAMYQPYADTGLKGFNLYADSLGVNGAAGNDNATAAFRASPGYQYQVDQATDTYARKAGALGMLGSGNTAAGVATLAGNLADQEYKGWQSGLAGLGQIGYNATGAQAGLTKGIGDLYAGQGTAEAGLYQGLAGLGTGALMQTGQNLVQSQKDGYLAGQQAQTNSWNALLGIGNIAASLGGRYLGGKLG